MTELKHYTPREERINISTHAVGLALSLVALVLLLGRANQHGNPWYVVGFGIFGASMIMLYISSTLYHSAKTPVIRARLRILDHASIYVLIAGTYTPFTLITLNGTSGWILFAATWSMALTGIILKLFFTGKYDRISTLMYVLMGWLVVFAIGPLIENFPTNGLLWLFAGGAAYTSGAVIYSIKKIRFNHAIFHIFVLLGSFSHFISVYFYVLPTQ